MAQKKVKFNQSGISNLPNDKPVVYKIQTEGGKTNYVGVAKRGRAQERLQEHLTEGNIPGSQVIIQQADSISKAKQTEARIISRTQPKYNEQGK